MDGHFRCLPGASKPDIVPQEDKRARIQVVGEPIYTASRLPLHSRVAKALTEYEELDQFMQPAKPPKSWNMLDNEQNKGKDNQLKVKETTFREMLAGQSEHCQIHDAMDVVINVLPGEASQHAQILCNLSYLEGVCERGRLPCLFVRYCIVEEEG